MREECKNEKHPTVCVCVCFSGATRGLSSWFLLESVTRVSSHFLHHFCYELLIWAIIQNLSCNATHTRTYTHTQTESLTHTQLHLHQLHPKLTNPLIYRATVGAKNESIWQYHTVLTDWPATILYNALQSNIRDEDNTSFYAPLRFKQINKITKNLALI